MPELVTDEQAREVLVHARTVAVLGAHDQAARAACYVPEYLHQQGYRVLPVNPKLVGRSLWGVPVVARLGDISEPVDIVDVFRRSADVAAHVDEILAMKPPPKVVWLQLGIVNHDATARLVAAGIDVIQDRCTLADHRRFQLPRVGA